MKTTLFFILTSLISVHVFSQDVINVKDGSTINTKVVEVTEDQVKYKDAANPDGPLYVMNKDKISSIHYKNGTEDLFSSNTTSAVSSSSLTTVVNGYNTAPNASPSTYVPDNSYSQPVYNNGGNAAGNTLRTAATVGIFALLAANSLHRGGYHPVNYCHNYSNCYRGGGNHWRRGGWR